MTILNSAKYLFLFVVFGIAAVSAFGQSVVVPGEKPQDELNPNAVVRKDGRQNLLMQLGLSRDQIKQLRTLNQDRRPKMEAAQIRVREATRSLDDAIYTDQLVDSDIETKLKELQLAQADIIRLRATNEIAVRKILTPEQLLRFRELRDRFEQMREIMKDRREERDRNKVDRQNRSVQVSQPIRKLIAHPSKP